MRLVLKVIHTPAFGGPHNQALHLCRPLRQAGWQTLVVLPQEEGSALPRLEAAGVPVRRLPLRRARATLNPATQLRFALQLRRDVAGLAQLIRESGADLVQVHGVQNPQGALAARRSGVPIVWQLLGTSAPGWLRRIASPMVSRLADVVMTTGVAVAEAHPGVARLGDRWVSFFPPLDLDLFRPDPRLRAAGRHELGVDRGQLLVGTVGNFFRAKAHEVFVEAAALVGRRRPEVVFRILGEPTPTHAAYYRRRVRDRARQLGLRDTGRLEFVSPGPRVAELLPAFDLFVLSSVAEGLPNVVLEAMGCGLPVVATAVGAVPEAVTDGGSGLLVPPRDAAAMAQAIERLAGDSGLRRRLGREARRTAERLFGVERCTERYLAAYQQALARRLG